MDVPPIRSPPTEGYQTFTELGESVSASAIQARLHIAAIKLPPELDWRLQDPPLFGHDEEQVATKKKHIM